MILHLIPDDKFTDYAINQFSSLETPSEFLFVKDSPDYQIKNLSNLNRVILITSGQEDYRDFIKKIDSYSAVIIHGFFYPWQEEIISHVHADSKIAWVCWGGEIYGRRQLLPHFLKNYTKFVYWKKQVKRFFKSKPLLGNEYFSDLSTYKKINYCLTDMQEEYQFVKKFTHSDMKYLWYNYYSIEETLGELQYEKMNGNNILVGNSCSIENNHLDAFNNLSKFEINNRKIIVPLSYGADWLRNIILKRCFNLFGNHFMPIIDFLALNDYNKLISSCSIMIMPHLRPQAQGNIITGLWLGAKVYLSQDSITYKYFQRIGAVVFSIENDLIPGNKEALTALSDDIIEQNRAVMLREYGKDNMILRINEIVEELNRTE